MKRLHIITQPTAIDDFNDLISDDYENAGELRAERREAKEQRKRKHLFV